MNTIPKAGKREGEREGERRRVVYSLKNQPFTHDPYEIYYQLIYLDSILGCFCLPKMESWIVSFLRHRFSGGDGGGTDGKRL